MDQYQNPSSYQVYFYGLDGKPLGVLQVSLTIPSGGVTTQTYSAAEIRQRGETRMSFVPHDARWYLAEMILQYEIQGNSKSLVHLNTKLVYASSPQAAYEKAMRLGDSEEIEYTNTDGLKVTVRFRGLRDLLVIYEDLADGAEIMYREIADMDEGQVTALATEKDQLGVFRLSNHGKVNATEYNDQIGGTGSNALR